MAGLERALAGIDARVLLSLSPGRLTSIIEKLCRNKKRLPRNDAEVRQQPNNQLRVGSSKLQKLASVKSSAVPAPRDLSGLRARIEKLL
jgi:hypothetical protein